MLLKFSLIFGNFVALCLQVIGLETKSVIYPLEFQVSLQLGLDRWLILIYLLDKSII